MPTSSSRYTRRVPSARSASSPDTIWAILTDAPGCQACDSGIERVDGPSFRQFASGLK
jgi:hypothetical protein